MKTQVTHPSLLTQEEWVKLKEDCRHAGGTLYLGAGQEELFVRLVQANKSNERGANYAFWPEEGKFRHQLRIRENGDTWVFEHVSEKERLENV